MGGDQAKQKILRSFSLVRNNIVDSSTAAQHLGQIDEDGELYLIDDLGADHEDSTPSSEDYDDDEILIVDKKR